MLSCLFALALIILIIILFASIFDECSFKVLVIALVVCVVFGIANFSVEIYRDSQKYTETIQTNQYELVSLQDESQISGNIKGRRYYVYASISTDEVYNFYYRLKDGGFKKGKVDAAKTIVYEKDGCEPVMIEYTIYTKSKMNETWQKILLLDTFEEERKTYKIYIPKGTITSEYMLDAQ